MQKTIEFLKSKGVIEDLQETFNTHKPPKGTPEEVILEAISSKIDYECDKSEDFLDAFMTAVYEDVAHNIRKELDIEFVEEDEFLKNLLPKSLIELIEKTGAKVQVHVVCLDKEKKGSGEE